jgi:hypothetical protein
MSAERKHPVSPPRAEAGRRVLIGVQWDGSSWTRAPLLVDRILRALHAVTLHWNLPAFPADADRLSPVAEVLRERLASSRDQLLAMGCTGACQPALALDELDREVAWGLRNPWSTGLVDVLGRRPTAAAPRLPDLDRPGAAAPFLRHGLPLVGIADGRPFSVAARHGLGVFRYARLPREDRAGLDAALRRLLAAEGDVFVMLDLATLPPAPGAAAPLIEVVAQRLLGSGRTVVSLADAALDAPAGDSPPTVPGTGEWRLFPTVTLRRRIASVEGARRRRRRRVEETRDLLARLSAGTPDPPPPPPEPPRVYADRGLIAHMQGETTLSGIAFDVRLAGGRFCGLSCGREALTPLRPAGSWVRADGRTLAARGRSAFSFEGDDGTGLREDLVIEPGGSLVVDYAFRGDDPVLSVEGSWLFPGLPPGAAVEEWAPLVLALAELAPGREVEVAYEAPDGSTGTCRLTERDGWRPVAGSRFRVPTGDGCLTIETGGNAPAWGVFLFRIARGRFGRRVLEVNPAGMVGPVPAELLVGTRGTFAFSIGLGRP